jgi:hypothetical protein
VFRAILVGRDKQLHVGAARVIDVLPLLLLARLFQQGLWKVRPYSALGVFLLVDLARDLALLLPPYDSHPYTLIWEATLPVLLLAQIGAGVATYAAITELIQRSGGLQSSYSPRA